MARYVPEGLKDDDREQQRPAASARGLGVRGWLRWMWRQLTSMRVALMLLLLLAVVALPGSFFPQRPQDPSRVADYLEANPDLGPFLDTLGFFDVYSSPWFSAVYLLLFVSLIGCIVPRTWAHLQAMRAGPGRVPRHFSRFPVRTEVLVRAEPGVVTERLERALGRGYKRRTDADGAGDVVEISAERGYGRETGNLVFHLALVGLLIVTAWGQLVQYRGQVVVVVGDNMVNSAVDYDSFDAGAWYDSDSQEPFRLRLDDFSSSFTLQGRPEDFVADVTLSRPGEESSSAHEIRVNSPLSVGSARVYLTGNGYAPVLTVTDAAGDIAFSGPVLFLPQDTTYTSTGVVLVPDANGGGERQLAFSGQLFPTALLASDGTVIGSGYPQPQDPVLLLNAWTGDLGLDDGIPRNLFTLDTTDLEQLTTTAADGTSEPLQLQLRPGESVELPDGQGSVTFSELRRYAALDVRWDPSVPWMGLFAGLAFAGLAASLFLPRRRLWLRLELRAGGTVVHAAALARGDDPGLQRELDRVLAAVGRRKPNRGPSAGPRSRGRGRTGGSATTSSVSRAEKKSDG